MKCFALITTMAACLAGVNAVKPHPVSNEVSASSPDATHCTALGRVLVN
jgi:hypothetical protein